MKQRLAVLSCLFAAVPVLGAPVRVMTSVLPQQYLADRIGGDRVETAVLVQPGQDPHIFEPTPRQMVFLSESDVFFRTGMEFEGGLMDRLTSVAPDLKVVDLRDGIDLLVSACEGHDHHGHDHHEDMPDPHIWTDPAIAGAQAVRIAEVLTSIDPEGADLYRGNLEALRAELVRLEADLREALAPVKGRAFMVYHPAWGYFARTFGLEQVAIEVSGKAPTGRQLVRIIDRARADGIRVIFVQPQFDDRAASRIAKAIGGAVVAIDPLAYDYIANLRTAAEAIRTALAE